MYLCLDTTINSRFNKVILANKANIDFVGVMGPGFNYLDLGIRDLRSGCGLQYFGTMERLEKTTRSKIKGPLQVLKARIFSIGTTQTTSFVQLGGSLGLILPQYPAELQELRKYNVGGFGLPAIPTLLKTNGDGGSKVSGEHSFGNLNFTSLIRGGQYARLEQKVVQKLVGVSDTQTLKAAIDSLSSPAAIKAKLHGRRARRGGCCGLFRCCCYIILPKWSHAIHGKVRVLTIKMPPQRSIFKRLPKQYLTRLAES